MTKPGPPPANEPAAFEFLTDNRLVHNSAITRMPTTQREWDSFIIELNKWIKNETGSFDVSSSDSAKFTGFSSDPSSANIWWHKYGQLVHLQFEFSFGTSDATDFTITGIPENLRPRDDMDVLCPGLRDGSASISPVGACTVTSVGAINFWTTPHHGVWTGSGTKGFSTSGRFSIIYSLRQPGKH